MVRAVGVRHTTPAVRLLRADAGAASIGAKAMLFRKCKVFQNDYVRVNRKKLTPEEIVELKKFHKDWGERPGDDVKHKHDKLLASVADIGGRHMMVLRSEKIEILAFIRKRQYFWDCNRALLITNPVSFVAGLFIA